MKLLERITVEPGKCGGRPCIRRMRIRVKDVLDMLADGATREEILAVVSRHVVLDPDKVVVRLERGKTVSTLEVDIEVPNNFDKSKALADRRKAG